MEVIKADRFSGMWSLHAGASVLGCIVRSIYPDYSLHAIRPMMDRDIHPRTQTVDARGEPLD